MTPLSGNAQHHLAGPLAWHARSMVLAWCVLLPLGALAARFFKVWPGQDWPRVLDHRAWWHAHRGLQWAGFACLLLGLALVWGRSSSWMPSGLVPSSGVTGGLVSGGPVPSGIAPQAPAAAALVRWHALGGWLVCGLCFLQVASGLARGSKGGPREAKPAGDHYDMTPWRRGFEWLHKNLGWLALLLSVLVVTAGLILVDAPRWMALLLALWWLALGLAFARLQAAGRCIDTYQAIWGPGLEHPGNRQRPIGWGVRRPKV